MLRGAAHAWRLSGKTGLREAVMVVLAFLVYFIIRGAVVNRADEAISHGLSVIHLEQNLRMYWEPTMQSWIVDHYWMIKTANWIYFWAHMPLIVVGAVWLYIRHRDAYHLTRNAFLASGAIGVAIYALYPVAPPRLIPSAGFVDTMAIFDKVGYQAQEVGAFVNPYAAVPSLHFGWSLLMGVIVFRVTGNLLLRVACVIWPIVMLFAIVMTGNHFILDAVAGGIVCAVGLAVAYRLQALWDARRGANRPPGSVAGRA